MRGLKRRRGRGVRSEHVGDERGGEEGARGQEGDADSDEEPVPSRHAEAEKNDGKARQHRPEGYDRERQRDERGGGDAGGDEKRARAVAEELKPRAQP